MRYVLFTSKNCSPCITVKKYLESEGIEYESFEASDRDIENYLVRKRELDVLALKGNPLLVDTENDNIAFVGSRKILEYLKNG